MSRGMVQLSGGGVAQRVCIPRAHLGTPGFGAQALFRPQRLKAPGNQRLDSPHSNLGSGQEGVLDQNCENSVLLRRFR